MCIISSHVENVECILVSAQNLMADFSRKREKLACIADSWTD